MNNYHLSLEAKLSSLYAPEISMDGSFSTPVPEGTILKMEGTIGGQEVRIVQAIGCTPRRESGNWVLSFHGADPGKRFSLVVAWYDPPRGSSRKTPWQRLMSLIGGLYPFESQVINLKFSGVECNLTTSLHLEVPHNITRYTKDTKNLQHMFGERGLRAPSYMGGITTQGQDFQMHFHYKSLDAFRRVSVPALTMIYVLLLDLAVMELAQGADKWSDSPGAVLAFLSINVTAFGSLAAIRVGSTLRSLLNLVRLMAVAWVVLLTVAIRAESIPLLLEYIGRIVDAGLKASVIWLCITGAYSFLPYALSPSVSNRNTWFGIGLMIGFTCWVLLVWLSPVIDAATSFELLVRR